MKLSIHYSGRTLAAISSLAALVLGVAGCEMPNSAPEASFASAKGPAIPPTGTLAQKGHKLFLLNCAHCHGTDARGDEGPDLHGVTKSDARIASLIKNGKKDEMPKFGTKLTDEEVQALIVFVRSLKE